MNSNAKISSLRLGNFKAFGPTQSFPVRPLTLIFGENSAGKSSILESLIFANEASLNAGSRETPLDVRKTKIGGDQVDLGGFLRFLHSPATKDPGQITWGVKVDLSATSLKLFNAKSVEIQFRFGRNAIDAQHSSVAHDGTPSVEDVTALVLCPSDVSFFVDSQLLAIFELERNSRSSAGVGKLLHLKRVNKSSTFFARLVSGASRVANGERGDFDPATWIAQLASEQVEIDLPYSKSTSLGKKIESRLRKEVVLFNRAIGLLTIEPGLENYAGNASFLATVEPTWIGNSSSDSAVQLAMSAFKESLAEIVALLKKSVKELRYVGPVRALPERNFIPVQGKSREDDSSGIGQYVGLASDKELLQRTNHWLARLGTGISVDVDTLLDAASIEPMLAAELQALLMLASEPISEEVAVKFAAWSSEQLAEILHDAQRRLEAALSLNSDGLAEVSGVKVSTNPAMRIFMKSASTLTRKELFPSLPRAIESIIDGEFEENDEYVMAANYFATMIGVAMKRGEYRLVAEFLAKNRTRQLASDSKGVFGARRVRLRDLRTDADMEFSDVGTGVSQCIPVIATLLGSKHGTVLIEQPELHLHPKLQADLGDLLIESALGAPGNTVIAETHSEHLILRVLRRIRETARGKQAKGSISIKPEDVSILYVERKGSSSVVRHIEVTKDGSFKSPWPGGFFEERLEELLK